MKYLIFLVLFSFFTNVVANEGASETASESSAEDTQKDNDNKVEAKEETTVEQASVQSDGDTPLPLNAYDVSKTWFYGGAFQINKFLTLQDVSLGARTRGRFYNDKYNISHRYDVQVSELPESYLGKDKRLHRHNYEFKVFTDPFIGGLTFSSGFDLFREQWGKAKGINAQLRIAVLAVEYSLRFSGMFKESTLGYAPLYEWQNYNLVNKSEVKTDAKSDEHFHHALKLRLGFEFSSTLSLSNDTQYTRASSLSSGERESTLNEISNKLKLFYQLNDNYYLLYKNDLVNQERRETKFGLKKNYLEQSINIVYRIL